MGDDSITARTANGQEIFVDSSVIYQIDPDQVVKVHILWQNRYPDRIDPRPDRAASSAMRYHSTVLKKWSLPNALKWSNTSMKK